MFKRTLLILLVGLVLLCCKPQTTQSIAVEHKGALKNFMQQGDLTAKVSLSEFKNKEHFYALGAMENLKGEIQIFDSRPLNTSVTDGHLVVDRSFDKKASLLVYASVGKWQSIPIPNNMLTYSDFEGFLSKVAVKHDINTDEPFPFLVEGKANTVAWHVIDWKSEETDITHEKHRTSGVNGNLKDQDVIMLGFYSNKHKGIFTHHSTNMHIHVKTNDGEIAGHTDDMILGEGMILKLPLER